MCLNVNEAVFTSKSIHQPAHERNNTVKESITLLALSEYHCSSVSIGKEE
jgi:hypothetical protein